MNSTMIDFIRKQQELKDKLMPKGLQKALEVQQKFQPLKTALQNLEISKLPITQLKSSIDLALHTQQATLSANPAMIAAIAMNNMTLGENLPLSMLAKSAAASGGLFPDVIPAPIRTAIAMQNKVNMHFASDFFKAGHFSNLSSIASILQEPNTSTLNETFEFARQISKSFILPDFSQLNFENDAEEEGKIIIQISPADIPKIIKEFYADHSRLNSINPRKFEEVIAEMFRYHGYEVTLTKQTRDGGFDMTLKRVLEDGTPFKAIVECKRHKKKIGVNVIRCFSAVAYKEGVRNGIIVTTSAFTRDATKESEFMPADLSLKGKSDIITWAGSYLGKMPVIDLDFSKRTKEGIVLLS